MAPPEDPEILAALVGRLEKTVEAGFDDMRREFRDLGGRVGSLEEWKSGVIAVDEERRKIAQDGVRERAYTRDSHILSTGDVVKVVLVILGVIAALLSVAAGVIGVVG